MIISMCCNRYETTFIIVYKFVNEIFNGNIETKTFLIFFNLTAWKTCIVFKRVFPLNLFSYVSLVIKSNLPFAIEIFHSTFL